MLDHNEIHTIAEEAVKSGLGVRYLETAVNKIMVEYEFDPSLYEYK